MRTLSADEFLNQVAESGVLAEGDLRLARARSVADDVAGDAEKVARRLVQEKKLTPYQAQQCFLGNGKSLALGNYVVLDKLGQGGMGVVLKAEHRRMERLVALKILSPAITQSTEALRRFQQEVKLAAKLSHPNIVAAYDADVAGNTQFFVMEYIEGRDLASLLADTGPLPVAVVLNYIRQAARGLAYAHHKGVVHRDIKPGNLLVDSEGTVKILDMGLARSDDAARQSGALAGITQSGEVMGTVDFMAPEQAIDTRKADARADIYSLGCTLFKLLTSENVFPGETIVQKLMAHQQQTIPSLIRQCPDVPAALGPVFERMVAKRPADRYQSMDEVEAALAAVAADMPAIKATDSIHPPKIATSQPTFDSHFVLHNAEGTVGDGVQRAGTMALAESATPSSILIQPTSGDQPPKEKDMNGTISDMQSASSSETIASRPVSIVHVKAPRPHNLPPRGRSRWPLIAAGFGAVILAAIGTWVIIRDKDGKEISRHRVPDGGSASLVADPSPPATVKPMPSEPKTNAEPVPATSPERERAAAEWVLGAGGTVSVVGSNQALNKVTELPQTPFQLSVVSLGGVKFDHRELGKLSSLPALTEIYLNRCPVKDEELALLRDLPNLKKLDVNDTRVTGQAIRNLKMFPRLEAILATFDWEPSLLSDVIVNHQALSFVDIGTAKLSPDDFKLFANLHNLRHVNAKGPVSDNALRLMVQANTLHTLSFENNQLLTDNGLAAIKELPLLRTLVFYGPNFSKLSEGMLEVVALNAPGLQVLGLPKKRFESSALGGLKRLENLSQLTLSGQQTTDDVVSGLSQLNQIERLRFFDSKVSKSSLEKLHEALPRCEIYSDAFGSIPSLAKVGGEQKIASVNKKLVDLNPKFDGTGRPIFERGLLVGIDLNSDQITNLLPVREIEGIKILRCTGSVGGAGEVSTGKLADLGPLKGLSLTSLDCLRNRISDLEPLRGMPLTNLILTNNPVEDLRPLEGMRLERLVLNGNVKVSDITPLRSMPLKHLSCLHTAITDISPLRGMPLEELGLRVAPISDLSPLHDCKKLKKCTLGRLKITAAEVEALQKALPDCTVVWDEAPKPTLIPVETAAPGK